MLEAVKKDGYALEFASKELQADREIVLEAVKANGLALEYASEKLQADAVTVATSIAQNRKAWKYAAQSVFEKCPLLYAACDLEPSFTKRQKLEDGIRGLEARLEEWSDVATILTAKNAVFENDKEWVEESIVAPLWHAEGILGTRCKRKHSELM